MILRVLSREVEALWSKQRVVGKDVILARQIARAVSGTRSTTPGLPWIGLGDRPFAVVGCRGLKGLPASVRDAAKLEAETRSPTARLVITHSSYMDGLIPLLERLVEDPDAASKVSSVVPARMYSCNGRSELFKMTVRVASNGFKALARKGTAAQEVFISTTKMDLDDVKAALNRAAGFDLEKGGSRREQKAGRKRQY